MRVAVDQAGCDPASAAIVDGIRENFGLVREVVAGTDPGDAATLDRQCAILDDAVGHAGMRHRGEPRVEPNRVHAVAGHCFSRSGRACL